MGQALKMDTLEASDTLQGVGFEKKQADTIIRVMASQRQEIDLSHLATKDDLKQFATKDDLADIKAEVADVKGEIAEVKTDLKWLKLIGGGIMAVTVLPYLERVLALG